MVAKRANTRALAGSHSSIPTLCYTLSARVCLVHPWADNYYFDSSRCDSVNVTCLSLPVRINHFAEGRRRETTARLLFDPLGSGLPVLIAIRNLAVTHMRSRPQRS